MEGSLLDLSKKLGEKFIASIDAIRYSVPELEEIMKEARQKAINGLRIIEDEIENRK